MPREAVHELDHVIDALRAEHMDASLDARIMDRVRHMPRLLPDTIPPRPARRAWAPWMLGVAAVVVVAVGLTRAVAVRAQDVIFALHAPAAITVAVVGDFNGWNRQAPGYRATRDARGMWTLRVPVREGHHRYSFVVNDSTWVADPAAPLIRDRDFGVANSALVVARRSR